MEIIFHTLGLSLWLGNSDSWFDFSGHHNESLLYIFAIFSWCLQESNVIVFCEFFSFICGDLSGIFHIAFVSDEDARYVVWGVLFDFIHPVFNGAETFSVCDVISHNNTMGSLVITGSNGLKSLLTCSVPLYLFLLALLLFFMQII